MNTVAQVTTVVTTVITITPIIGPALRRSHRWNKQRQQTGHQTQSNQLLFHFKFSSPSVHVTLRARTAVIVGNDRAVRADPARKLRRREESRVQGEQCAAYRANEGGNR